MLGKVRKAIAQYETEEMVNNNTWAYINNRALHPYLEQRTDYLSLSFCS